MSAIGGDRSAPDEQPFSFHQASNAQQQKPYAPSTNDHEGEDSDGTAARVFPSFPGQQRHQRRVNRRGLWTLLLLLAFTTMGTRLFSLPLNRAVELRYCRAYYERLGDPSVPPVAEIPEEMCKVKEVQQRLAWLQGVVETLIVGIDLAVTMPLGWVGDRFGRKVVLALNAVGFACLVAWVVLVGRLDGVFPVEAMVAGPFFTILGGHDCVLTSTIFAMVTDLTDDLIQRTSYIAYISSVNYVISLFGPSLASFTMSRDIWLPFYLSIGFFTAALPTIYLLPSTAPQRRKASPSNTGHDDAHEEESLLGSDSISAVRSNKPTRLSARILAPVKTVLRLVLGRRNFQIHLIGGFFLPALASSNTHLLPQYTSKRYDWKFQHVGYLLSIKAAVNITLLALVIPVTMRTLLKRMPGKEVRLNYRGAQVSLTVSILGALSIAAAGTVGVLMCALIIYALGSALPVFTMSLVESAPIAAAAAAATASSSSLSSTTPSIADEDVTQADREESSFRDDDSRPNRNSTCNNNHSNNAQQDYSVVMLVKTVGSLVGAPLMTLAWVKGIGLGGAALGLPYFLSSILYAGAAAVLCLLRL
ncbi:major facilitator superfamily transporter [Diplodia corticola]|uniref:Major facilitator superfamily transporter n=1 Tax=Diplodia corticola TaxID=236234 RepID=A0A1J9QMP9_9PEZI|nr:major facilitator superfamily transporter [Diplodia corticola]OJD29752.1 major facilitator superfamily transporter [Diplodia corticola]